MLCVGGGQLSSWRRIAALRILADTRPEAALEQLEHALATGSRAVIASAVTVHPDEPRSRAGGLVGGYLVVDLTSATGAAAAAAVVGQPGE